MNNPFSYSGIVSDNTFCNREKEQNKLLNYIRNSQNILIYSNRKTGKSSLIHKVFKRLNKEKPIVKTVYIDLYGTLSEQDFIDALFTGLAQIEPQYKKLLNSVAGLKLISSIDPGTNMPAISFSTEPSEKKNLLRKAMQTLESYSKKNRLVVGFDEFQEIAGYTEKGFEKRLRSFIQLHSRISYIFSGSQKHILSDMFNSAKKAFYQSAQSFPLEKIEKHHYVSWAQSLFEKKKVALSSKIIENIVEKCNYQPAYIQQFLFNLWKSKKISIEKLTALENEIIQSHKNEYISIFDNLTVNQKKALKLIAKTGGKAIYQTNSLNSIGFKSGSLLARAIKSLVDKELISKNKNYQIQDIMLKKWIMTI